ncbi:hypothetical protein [Singulisphaera sp. PoT]|uniref:hypothetical protein n=1 Tax=Singulisphaera sp. PoT TaxID=3411797 RepID=UPI003BF49FAC
MPSRGLRGLLLLAAATGFLAPTIGCGSSDSGTHVKVDKEKENAVLKAMGGYMEKQQSKAKSKRHIR